MKKLAIAILLSMSASLQTFADKTTYFPYPEPPKELVTLSARTNYLVEHFWDRCDLKSAFSSHAKMAEAFKDYVSFMPYAAADTVHASINKLLERMKKHPKNMLALGEIAEANLYSDTAQFISDELYLPFAKAVAATKKVPSASRARFEHHALTITNSQIGASLAEIKFETPTGEKADLSKVEAQYVLLFINDPECEDCAMARVRLAADYNTRQLIDKGIVKVVSLLPDEASDEWKETVAIYPENWIVGACPDIDDTLDLRYPPVMYFLDKDKKILLKNLKIDNVINAFGILNNPQPSQPQ